VFNHHYFSQVVEVDHHPGQDPCARQPMQGIANGVSTPNQKIRENPSRLVMFGVNDELELNHGFQNDPGLSFPVHPRKRMTARVTCFPMFSLNFPIFF